MSCEICKQIPHNPRCPNYFSDTTYQKCYFCKDDIQIGEEYIEAYNGDVAHLECCSLSGTMDTLKFLDVDVIIMEK